MVNASSRTWPSNGPTGAAELSMQIRPRPCLSTPGHAMVPVAQAARSNAKCSAGAAFSGAMGLRKARQRKRVDHFGAAASGCQEADTRKRQHQESSCRHVAEVASHAEVPRDARTRLRSSISASRCSSEPACSVLAAGHLEALLREDTSLLSEGAPPSLTDVTAKASAEQPKCDRL